MELHTIPHQKAGIIEVITGCMFSGKTEELIRRMRKARYAKQKVIVFKHAADSARYDPVQLASHNGTLDPAIPVRTVEEMRALVTDDITVVGIDEAQFFGKDEGLVEFLEWLRLTHRRTVVAALKQDYRGRVFGPMAEILVTADQITVETAVCTICCEPAGYSQLLRVAADPTLVTVVGGKEEFAARCLLHWNPNGEEAPQ